MNFAFIFMFNNHMYFLSLKKPTEVKKTQHTHTIANKFLFSPSKLLVGTLLYAIEAAE